MARISSYKFVTCLLPDSYKLCGFSYLCIFGKSISICLWASQRILLENGFIEEGVMRKAVINKRRYYLRFTHNMVYGSKFQFMYKARSEEIVSELEESQAETLILLGDIPVLQFLNRVAEVNYKNLQEYVDLYGYGNYSQTTINGKTYNILPLAHPRQIGALGAHSARWYKLHQEWENNQR